MGKHALLSASSSHRWLNCPPSARLCETYGDKGSGYAAEGTDAHTLGEYKLKTALGIKAKDPTANLTYYSEEMDDCASGYAAYIFELVEKAKQVCSDPVVLIEQRLDFSKYVEEGFGTGDCVVIADGTLHIVDYKHGQGVLVEAEDNPQMKLYALGALELFDGIYDIDRVSMTIYQPRRDNISTHTVFKESLYQWADDVLKPTAEIAYSGGGEYNCGEWCQFCKAKHECRKRAEANMALARYDFKRPPLLEDDEIEGILGKITGGFCCQDLSVAGKRAGLHGERSGLFFQVTRIIREMLAATNNEYPKFAVLENVPGMYSSNGGLDFQEVLNELIHIKDESAKAHPRLSVPLPEKGRWSTAGEIVGDGFSVGWRTLDAQFWGVAQRRRRCYIVVDFTGERAGEILFDETRLRGNPPPSGFPWQGTAGSAAAGSGSPVHCLNDQGGSCMDLSEDVTGTLRAQEHGHQPIVFEPGAASRIGGHAWESIAGALRADAGDNQQAVCIENHPADSRVRLDESGVVQTLSSRMGTGGGNVPLVMNDRQYALTVGEDVANTLTSTDYKGTQCVFEPAAFMGGQGAKARSIAYSEDTSPTLRSEAGGNSVPMAVYGLVAKNSNSWKSDNPHSGCYEMQTARTLDTSVPDPNKNAGGMAVVAIEGNGSRPSHRGDGYSEEDVAYTLNAVEHHAVCYQDKVGALCASDYKFPQSQQIEEGKAVVERVVAENYQHGGYREVDKAGTLKASGGDYPGGENVVVENRYVVRRLTPTECALLQGFPPDWCEGLETPEPTEEDIAFWTEVWETHRSIIGTSSKPKSRNQIVKWLQDPHSDAAEYKMWGNGVALPCVVFVLSGIVYSSRN